MYIQVYDRNMAFDFGALEERKVKKGKIFRLPNEESRRKEKLKNQKSLLVGVFSLFFVTALGVSGFIMGQAKLTEVTDKYSKASKQLQECQSVNTGLEMKLKEVSNISKSSNLSKESSVEIVKIHKGDTARIS